MEDLDAKNNSSLLSTALTHPSIPLNLSSQTMKKEQAQVVARVQSTK